jgi:hypothetical protein
MSPPPANTRGVRQADAGTRTPDPLLTMEVLYQLSYVGGPRNPSRSRASPNTRRSGLRKRVYASSAEAAWNLPIACPSASPE